jgi:hypothetical protein
MQRYIEQNVHALWLQPVVTCRMSEYASNGGRNVRPV